MQYTITRTPAALGSPDAVWDGPVWQQAEELAVAHFPWSDSGHHPARRLASFTMTNFSESSSVDVSEADGDTILVAHSMPKIVDPEITEATVWTVEYHVPFTLFASYFEVSKPTSGTRWKGNCYKCGDLTSHPHWGSWAPVDTPSKSFHQPTFFQPLLFA